MVPLARSKLELGKSVSSTFMIQGHYNKWDVSEICFCLKPAHGAPNIVMVLGDMRGQVHPQVILRRNSEKSVS